MHICFITSEYPKQGFPHGGVGSFIKIFSKELVKKDVQVSVLGLNYINSNEVESDDGVTIYRLKKSNIKGISWYFNSKAINQKIQSIHTESPISIVESSELGLAFINKIKGVNYIIRLHGGHHFFAEAEKREINWWKGFQEKKSFKKADAFIAVSEYVKKHTANYLSYHNKPIEVIFNPIDVQKFQPNKAIEVENYNITFAGTICEKKGVRQLIQAFPFVKEKFPKAILNLYGRDWNFPNGKSYIQMLKETELPKLGNISNDIIFHGAVSFQEIPKAYAKATVCVFPSHMETLGLVAPEAMALQKVVVFTKEGPGPEVIQHKIDGLLCNPYIPKDIADNIIYVFEHPEQCKQLGIKAREEVIKKFDIEFLVEKNRNFYQSILTK